VCRRERSGATALSDHRFDTPGAARTPRPEGPLSSSTMADAAAALLGAPEVESAHVAGFSMGSAIARSLLFGSPGSSAAVILPPRFGRSAAAQIPDARFEVMTGAAGGSRASAREPLARPVRVLVT